MKISYRVNINIMSLKDHFLPLYGFPIFRGPLHKISQTEWWNRGWYVDTCADILKMMLEPWNSGRMEENFLFQNFIPLGLGLLWGCVVSQGTAGFQLLMRVGYSSLLALQECFSLLWTLRLSGWSYGHRSNVCVPLGYAICGSWPWTVPWIAFHEKYPFPFQGSFSSSLTRGSNSVKTIKTTSSHAHINYSTLRDDKYIQHKAGEQRGWLHILLLIPNSVKTWHVVTVDETAG